MNQPLSDFNLPDSPEEETSLSLAQADAAEALFFDEGEFLAPGEVAITTEKLPGKRRRILAAIHVPRTAEQIWQVLTDYDNLADFIPNLASSKQLTHSQQGVRLEQIGAQCFLNVQVCARVVLDMVEVFPRELRFSLVEGDFREFFGTWQLTPIDSHDTCLTRLSYELTVLPPRAMPIRLIEGHIRRDLSQNLQAICDRTTTLFANT